MTDKEPRAATVEALIREIRRYLVFVDAVRAGCPDLPHDKRAKKDG